MAHWIKKKRKVSWKAYVLAAALGASYFLPSLMPSNKSEVVYPSNVYVDCIDRKPDLDEKPETYLRIGKRAFELKYDSFTKGKLEVVGDFDSYMSQLRKEDSSRLEEMASTKKSISPDVDEVQKEYIPPKGIFVKKKDKDLFITNFFDPTVYKLDVYDTGAELKRTSKSWKSLGL